MTNAADREQQTSDQHGQRGEADQPTGQRVQTDSGKSTGEGVETHADPRTERGRLDREMTASQRAEEVQDRELDEALDESFPASDPPAATNPTTHVGEPAEKAASDWAPPTPREFDTS
jgi:hypothetical protein